MSKKSLIILVTFLLILFGGAIAYLFLSIKPSTIVDTNTVEDGDSNPFPFGNGIFGGGNRATSTGTGSGNRPPVSGTTRPILQHLSLVPVAGAGIYTSGSSTVVRYIERGTGYIYQNKVGETEAIKLSNTPMIKIYDAFWTDKNNALIVQKLKDDAQTIDSFLVTMSSPSLLQASSTSLEGSLSSKITPSFLGSNIQSFVLSPAKDRMAYLTSNTTGGVVGIISKTDGSKKTQFFDSPLKSWLLSLPNEATATLTTKPLSTSPGYLYFISTITGVSNKILGGINGLTTLTNTDTTRVLLSKSTDTGIETLTYDVKNSRADDPGITTLPEKCVWSKKEKTTLYCAIPYTIPRGSYPDAWYQGRVSFVDELWKVDTLTGILERVADLRAISGQDIDAINPILSDREDLLVFINKKDLTLWSLELQ